uniref:Putative secreted protein n=1 Tax=Anopheles darlingi TaxID=43151 RepID=A0A2M4DD49_ANODA
MCALLLIVCVQLQCVSSSVRSAVEKRLWRARNWAKSKSAKGARNFFHFIHTPYIHKKASTDDVQECTCTENAQRLPKRSPFRGSTFRTFRAIIDCGFLPPRERCGQERGTVA